MEVELKLLLSPDDLRRVRGHPAITALHAVRGRTEQLESVYYDTSGAALARAGVAFRVRKIGRRWIQTIKAGGRAAAGLHEREEWEWRLPGAVPDADLVAGTPLEDLFSRLEVGGRLKPVFRTGFERVVRPLAWPDGTSAELALDHGSVQAGGRSGPISEMELELQSGDPTRLFELAQSLLADMPLRVGHASKAERGYVLARLVRRRPQKRARIELEPAMPFAAAIQRIALACVAQMQANEAGFLRGRDPEYLHQLRVGLRRLRSCVSLVRKHAPPERIAALAEELRWLGRGLNPARDWDVLVTETLPPLLRDFPEDPGLAALVARATRLRRAGNAVARQMIRSSRYTGLLLAVGSAFAREDLAALGAGTGALTGPLENPATQLIERRDAKLRKRGSSLREAAPEARHAARIAAKRLRYATEFFAPLYPPKRVKRYVGPLEDIQDTLGRLNDLATAERLLSVAGKDGGYGPDTATAGVVRGWCAATARQELLRLAGDWKRFRKTKAFWK